RLALPAAAHVRVAIYDAGGREVVMLANGDRPAGESTLIWDGSLDAGAVAASGLYFARLGIGGRTVHRPVAPARWSAPLTNNRGGLLVTGPPLLPSLLGGSSCDRPPSACSRSRSCCSSPPAPRPSRTTAAPRSRSILRASRCPSSSPRSRTRGRSSCSSTR